jgi:hypothetical protein
MRRLQRLFLNTIGLRLNLILVRLNSRQIRIVIPVLIGRVSPLLTVDDIVARMNGMVTLELVDLASARCLLNRRLIIALGVPITGVKLESVACTGKL